LSSEDWGTKHVFFISGKNRNEVPAKRSKLDVDSDLVKPSSAVSSSKPLVDAASILKNNPLKWSVQQVCDFVKNLPGCSDYVEDFQLQEIDGQALMLLKADHLMSAMAIKLGPALKICSAIDEMREALKQNWRRAKKRRILFKLGETLVGDIQLVQEDEDDDNGFLDVSPGSSPDEGIGSDANASSDDSGRQSSSRVDSDSDNSSDCFNNNNNNEAVDEEEEKKLLEEFASQARKAARVFDQDQDWESW
jgi:hypothetical protein